jgi:hypothetical protein
VRSVDLVPLSVADRPTFVPFSLYVVVPFPPWFPVGVPCAACVLCCISHAT